MQLLVDNTWQGAQTNGSPIEFARSPKSTRIISGPFHLAHGPPRSDTWRPGIQRPRLQGRVDRVSRPHFEGLRHLVASSRRTRGPAVESGPRGVEDFSFPTHIIWQKGPDAGAKPPLQRGRPRLNARRDWQVLRETQQSLRLRLFVRFLMPTGTSRRIPFAAPADYAVWSGYFSRRGEFFVERELSKRDSAFPFGHLHASQVAVSYSPLILQLRHAKTDAPPVSSSPFSALSLWEGGVPRRWSRLDCRWRLIRVVAPVDIPFASALPTRRAKFHILRSRPVRDAASLSLFPVPLTWPRLRAAGFGLLRPLPPLATTPAEYPAGANKERIFHPPVHHKRGVRRSNSLCGNPAFLIQFEITLPAPKTHGSEFHLSYILWSSDDSSSALTFPSAISREGLPAGTRP